MVITVFPFATTFLVGTVVLGCGLDQECPGDDFLTGEVIETVRGGDQILMVVGDVDRSQGGHEEQMIASLSEKTPIILRRADGSLVGGNTDDLVPGAMVRVCYNGREMRSGTLQVDAMKIVILSSPAFR
jgi:hypothetical protein